MLKNLNFSNFKTWCDADLKCGKITGLFGTNSSGKTSLLQFLLLLKQTKEATDRSVSLEINGQYVKLGSYSDLIHNHDTTLELSWKIEFETPDLFTIVDPSERRTKAIARSKSIALEGIVKSAAIGPVSRYIKYSIGKAQSFSLAPKKPDDPTFDLKAEGGEFRFIRTPGRAWQLPGPVKSYAFPDQARTYFQNASFLADLEKSYEDQIDKIYYLGPLREYPKRDYTWSGSRPRDVGDRGEKVVDAILAATAAGERRNLKHKGRLKEFQEMIAFWLYEMGLIYDFHVDELAKGSNYWQAQVQTREGGPMALLTDVGFGVSQVLPIVTLLYYVPEGSTVILEQPEIHLHPLAQAHLADLLINVAEHRRVQIIIESHSEHLLLRIQRRIAEGEINTDDVALYFCGAPDGESKLEKLEVDMYGQIGNWPENFMGDAFGETVAAERARLKRMQGAR